MQKRKIQFFSSKSDWEAQYTALHKKFIEELAQQEKTWATKVRDLKEELEKKITEEDERPKPGRRNTTLSRSNAKRSWSRRKRAG